MAAGGVSGNSLLYESTDCSRWRAALDSYEEAVRLVTSQKKQRKGETLAELDNWLAGTDSVTRTPWPSELLPVLL